MLILLVNPEVLLLIRSFLFLILLTFSMLGYASAIVGFDATVTGIPDVREDGSPMAGTEIKAFRVFKVGTSGLEALTPDIVYNQEVEAKGSVFMSSDVAQGEVDLCVMTIDAFDQISTVCSDVIPVPFKVSPPGAPGNSDFTQSVTFNITVTGG